MPPACLLAPHTTHRLAKVAARGQPVATLHLIDTTDRATTTRTPTASRGGSHTIAPESRARIDRAQDRRQTQRGPRTRGPRRHHASADPHATALAPPRACGTRAAVDPTLGACWPCEESSTMPAGRPAQARGSVGDQGGANNDSSVDDSVTRRLEPAGRNRAPRDRDAFEGGFESRAPRTVRTASKRRCRSRSRSLASDE